MTTSMKMKLTVQMSLKEKRVCQQNSGGGAINGLPSLHHGGARRGVSLDLIILLNQKDFILGGVVGELIK